MKNNKLSKWLVATLWFAFFLGVFVLSFSPPPPISPPSITVKVAPPTLITEPEEPDETVPTEDEALPPPSPPENAIVPPPPEGLLPPEKRVKVAIVIDDMGWNIRNTRRALLLPPEITLSFLPYASKTREEAKKALERGHEVLLHLPMEPLGALSAGPDALMIGLPMSELKNRLERALTSFEGFEGVNNHMGSKFTAYPEGMALVIESLSKRGLYFLDSRTTAQTVGLKIAEEKGLPAIMRDVFLDDDISPEAVAAQLKETEAVARRKGFAVAIGHPHEATINALEKWVIDAPGRGIDIVPLKALIKRETRPPSPPSDEGQPEAPRLF